MGGAGLSTPARCRNVVARRPSKLHSFRKRGKMGLVVALLILLVGQVGRVPVPPRHMAILEQACTHRARWCRSEARRADVLIMGDSRVLLGIDNRILATHLRLPDRPGEPTVVGLALLGSAAATDLWMWRRITAGGHSLRARLAVIGLRAPLSVIRIPEPSFLTEPAVALARPRPAHYLLRYLYEAPDVLWLIRDRRLSNAAALLTYRIFPLYARQESWRNWISGQEVRPTLDPRQERPPVKRKDRLAARRRRSTTPTINDFDVRCLNEMLADMSAHGVRAVLVSPPVELWLLRLAAQCPQTPLVRGSLVDGAPGSPLQLWKSAAQALADEKGVPYLDYMRPEQVVRFQYWDPSHLSVTSAAAFTRDLAARINVLLPTLAGPQPWPKRTISATAPP